MGLMTACSVWSSAALRGARGAIHRTVNTTATQTRRDIAPPDSALQAVVGPSGPCGATKVARYGTIGSLPIALSWSKDLDRGEGSV